MKKKFLIASFCSGICVAFALGFCVAYFKFSYRIHTKYIMHSNGKLAREVSYKSKVYGFFPDENKHGMETKYDENGQVIETGEWKDGQPWNGRCFVPAAGDAGTSGGLGKYHTFKDGKLIKETPNK